MHKLIAILLLTAASASGSMLNATFGWVPPLDGISFTGATLGSATSVTISPNEVINNLPPTFLGKANDLFPLLAFGNSVLIAPADLSLPVVNLNGGFMPDALPLYAEWGSANRFTFDAAMIEWTSSASTNLSFLLSGTLTDHSGVFDPSLAQISGSFTTTGVGAVNASFTFSSQPLAEVDEPRLAYLAGAVLTAICWWRRRVNA